MMVLPFPFWVIIILTKKQLVYPKMKTEREVDVYDWKLKLKIDVNEFMIQLGFPLKHNIKIHADAFFITCIEREYRAIIKLIYSHNDDMGPSLYLQIGMALFNRA